MVAFEHFVVIQQPAHGGSVFFPGFIAIHQHMPLNTHSPGEFYQRFQTRLGKLNDLHPFRIKMMAALAGQLVDNPGFRLPLHQQPAASSGQTAMKRG